MGAERHKPGGLLSPGAPQDPLHRRPEVVVAEPVEYTSEIAEGVLVGVQKCLLRGMQVGPVEGATAGHAPHHEHLQGQALTPEVRVRLIPVHLGFASPCVVLRHERLPRHQAEGQLPLPDVLPDRGLRHGPCRPLLAEPDVDAMGRVPLLARRSAVRLQDGLNEVDHRPHAWPCPAWRRLQLGDRALERLPHQPSMHA